MSYAWVVGAAMTRFGKETPDLLALVERTVADALADAGIGPGEAQLVELTDQLRGRARGWQVTRARLGLAENGGGVLDGDEAVVALTLLEKTGP
jgi:hypothetical protein